MIQYLQPIPPALIRYIEKNNQGIILISGVTGTGKTVMSQRLKGAFDQLEKEYQIFDDFNSSFKTINELKENLSKFKNQFQIIILQSNNQLIIPTILNNESFFKNCKENKFDDVFFLHLDFISYDLCDHCSMPFQNSEYHNLDHIIPKLEQITSLSNFKTFHTKLCHRINTHQAAQIILHLKLPTNLEQDKIKQILYDIETDYLKIKTQHPEIDLFCLTEAQFNIFSNGKKDILKFSLNKELNNAFFHIFRKNIKKTSIITPQQKINKI